MRLLAKNDAPHPYPRLSADDACIFSGVRFLRNAAGHRFISQNDDGSAADERHGAKKIYDAAMSVPDGRFSSCSENCIKGLLGYLLKLESLSPVDAAGPGVRNGLALHARKPDGQFLMFDQADHSALTVFGRGTGLDAHFARAMDSLDELEKRVSFAWDPVLGYLTAAPDRVGTGMEVFRVVHLEGLYLIGELEAVLRSFEALQIGVRSVQLDGFSAAGHVFMLENRKTLGMDEREILEGFRRATDSLLEQELNARARLVREMPVVLSDSLHRALAIMRECRLLSSAEFLDLLGPVALAASLGFTAGVPYGEILDLFIFNEIDSAEAKGETPEEADRTDAKLAQNVHRFADMLKIVNRGRRSLP